MNKKTAPNKSRETERKRRRFAGLAGSNAAFTAGHSAFTGDNQAFSSGLSSMPARKKERKPPIKPRRDDEE
jgi:hypothetical protein